MLVKRMTVWGVVVLAFGLVGGVGLLRGVAPGAPDEDDPPKGKRGVLFDVPEGPKKQPDDLRKLQGAFAEFRRAELYREASQPVALSSA